MTTAADKSATKSHDDAYALLTQDHKKAKKLFADFKKLNKSDTSDEAKASLVGEICTELTIHAQIEEEIFYPAVRAAMGDEDLMDEADVEHAGAKSLIAQLSRMRPGDDHYDAKVTVLGENIDHHVKEEEEKMFPKAKKAKVDSIALGTAMLKRKHELDKKTESAEPLKSRKTGTR